MTPQEAQNGVDILRSLRAAGRPGTLYVTLCQHFHGWAMTHADELVNLACASVGLPAIEPLVQNDLVSDDVEVRGNAPAWRA